MTVRRWISRPRSLRARTSVAAALTAVALFGAGAWEMRHVAYDQQMQEATTDAKQQAELIISNTTPSGWPVFDSWGKFPYELVGSGGLMSSSSQLKAFETGRKAVMPLPPARHNMAYWGSATASFPRSRSSPLSGTTVTSVTATLPVRYLDLPRGAGHPDMIPGGKAPDAVVRVYVFVTTGAAQAAVAALDKVLYPAVPAAVLLVAGTAYLVARRALRPVEQIRARTAAVTAADPRERVAVPATGDEIARLAITINATLERLEAASRTQRRFVADAAHELRSPLASLLATLEVAEAYPERAAWPETVATAAGQARRLQALASDLLLLARLDFAPAASEERVDLVALAEDMAADVAARRVAVTVAVTDNTGGCALIAGNPVQVERMLRNLVDNAVRFARASVQISVSTQDGEAVLTVQDDGPGIPAADHERIFDRFTRLEDDRARATGGTGLGLAIAREITEHHHGTLHVVGSAGGARFTARFPLAPS